MRPLALAFLLVPALGSAQTVLLRFRPPVGTTVAYVQTMTMRQTVPGAAKPIVSITTFPTTLRVMSQKNGVTKVETKTGRVKLEIAADNSTAAMKESVEKTASNVTTKVSVDERGNPKVSKLASQGPNAEFGAVFSQGVQGITYPTGPLKPGDTWTDTRDIDKILGASMAGTGVKAEGKATFAYRLVGVSNGMTRLVFTMRGAAQVKEGAVGTAVRMSMVGEATVEVASGLTQAMTSTADTTMTMMGGTMRQHVVTMLKRVP